MAVPHFARVTGVTELGPDSRLLDLQIGGAEPLSFLGGQYIIVDSGQVLPNGKAAKRAYSLLSADGERRQVQLAVKRIPGGLCSGFLHQVAVGAELKFSGPWGRLYPPAGASGRTLVVATDTGITAALGLMRGHRFRPLLGDTALFWFRTGADYFLPDALMKACLPGGLDRLEILPLPGIGHPERLPWIRRQLGSELKPGRLSQAYCTGDGAVNYALLEDLSSVGVTVSPDSVDSFFNMPRKSAS